MTKTNDDRERAKRRLKALGASAHEMKVFEDLSTEPHSPEKLRLFASTLASRSAELVDLGAQFAKRRVAALSEAKRARIKAAEARRVAAEKEEAETRAKALKAARGRHPEAGDIRPGLLLTSNLNTLEAECVLVKSITGAMRLLSPDLTLIGAVLNRNPSEACQVLAASGWYIAEKPGKFGSMGFTAAGGSVTPSKR